MKQLIGVLAAFSLGIHILPAQVISIAQARLLPAGSTVTVRGVVTNGQEMGKIRYMQDGTAGIAAFPGTGSAAGFEQTVVPGDSIEVTGTTVVFHDLLEISPITSFQVITSGNPMPVPKQITLAELSDDLESQLVSISCVAFNNGGGTFATSGTFDIYDADGGSAKVFLRANHPMLGTAIPSDPVLLTSILSEYDDFQLLPRATSDLVISPCFYYTQSLEQSDIQTTSFKLDWKTNLTATATVRYGTDPQNLAGTQTLGTPAQNHEVTLAGLEPGKIYWAQVEATHNGGTILSEKTPFATRSLSSGEIKIYFTRPIDESASNGLLPAGQSPSEAIAGIIERINAAEQTIDVAMYNNERVDITAALADAQARGVRVRYVAAIAGTSPALDNTPPFPVIYGNASGLMHNKFMAIDANLTDKAWIMGGSLNWTNANLFDDFNNAVWIQDQSLARAYTLEFEEMWGSADDQPDLTNSRFGPAKTDNTPHQFIVAGAPVELYFSPSDRVTSQLVKTINTTDNEALFALLTFTKDDQALALSQQFNDGATVQGLIENIGDQGTEYTYLANEGIEVRQHAYAGTLHHKYAVIDAGYPANDPTVTTGSHNWSTAAETSNDENTLILHHAETAILYKAEFLRRWSENLTPVHAPVKTNLRIFPNPVSHQLVLTGANAGTISIRDGEGKEYLYDLLHSSGKTTLQLDRLPAGNYIAVIKTRDGYTSLPFQKI